MDELDTDQKRKIAYGWLEEMKSMLHTQNVLFFTIGKKLVDLKEKELYRFLGDGGYETWSSFLGSGDLSIGQSTANAYMQLYNFWIKDKGYEINELADIPYDKLRLAFPAVKNIADKDKLDEELSKIRTLSRSDLRIEMGLSDDEGKAFHRIISLELCPVCKKYKLPEDLEICDCKLDSPLTKA